MNETLVEATRNLLKSKPGATRADVASALSISTDRARHLIREAQIGSPQPGPNIDWFFEKARTIATRNGVSAAGLKESLGVSDEVAAKLLDRLEKSGAEWHGRHLRFAKPDTGRLSLKFLQGTGKPIRVGLVGDTHLCSTYARLDALNLQYDLFAAEGITDVLHAGNIVDGHIPRINGGDLLAHSIDEQTLFCIDNYPKRKGITTHFITGDDHESWFSKDASGFNFGRYLMQTAKQEGRQDLNYIGHIEADVEFSTLKGGVMLKIQHPGGGCFTEGAEILTRETGWVDFRNLSKQDEVATMSKETGFFEWQRPTEITDKEYSGEVLRFTARAFDCEVTPNHGFWVRQKGGEAGLKKTHTHPTKAHPRVDRGWRRMEAEDVASEFCRQRFAMQTASSGWVGRLTPEVHIPRRDPKNPGNRRNSAQMQHLGTLRIEDAAELIAWFVTEGYAGEKGVSICQSKRVNPENHARICALLTRIGARYGTSGPDEKNITVGSVELRDWLVDQCGNGSYKKGIPLWLKDQPREILSIVYDTMILGDGWESGRSRYYRSFSPRLQADLGEIAQKLGLGVSYNPRDTSTVYTRHVQNEPTLNKPPTRRDYQGRVYCCTVPNGLIFVRQNGRCFWSHNSAYARSYTSQKIVESLEGGEKPHFLVLGHYHVSSYIVERNVHVISLPGFQDQTVFARKKRLRMEVGGSILQFYVTEAGTPSRVSVEFNMFYNRSFYKPFLRSDEGGRLPRLKL